MIWCTLLVKVQTQVLFMNVYCYWTPVSSQGKNILTSQSRKSVSEQDPYEVVEASDDVSIWTLRGKNILPLTHVRSPICFVISLTTPEMQTCIYKCVILFLWLSKLSSKVSSLCLLNRMYSLSKRYLILLGTAE